eukprot:jgi/Bigna1/138136/aug1.43_g12844
MQAFRNVVRSLQKNRRPETVPISDATIKQILSESAWPRSGQIAVGGAERGARKVGRVADKYYNKKVIWNRILPKLRKKREEWVRRQQEIDPSGGNIYSSRGMVTDDQVGEAWGRVSISTLSISLLLCFLRAYWTTCSLSDSTDLACKLPWLLLNKNDISYRFSGFERRSKSPYFAATFTVRKQHRFIIIARNKGEIVRPDET